MTVVIILTAHELALPVIFCYFAFAAPVAWLWREIFPGKLGKQAKA
jgi:hypothetical protein